MSIGYNTLDWLGSKDGLLKLLRPRKEFCDLGDGDLVDRSWLRIGQARMPLANSRKNFSSDQNGLEHDFILF